MKRILYVVLALVLAISLFAACTQQPAATEPTVSQESVQDPAQELETPEQSQMEPVTIEFWYVPFTNWDQAMSSLIADFESANPDVKINPVPVPYDDFNEKVAVMVPVGEGPDVIVPYHGWVPIYKKSGFIAPIPEAILPASELKETLVDAADAMVFDGEYYGVPFYIMNYAVYYNKDYFAEAGIDAPPTTWDELRDAAIQCTQRDSNGNIRVNGYYQHFSQQDHIIWKNLLVQWGQPLFTPDGKSVTWNSTENGYEAWDWFLGLTTRDKVSEPYFNESAYAAFYTGEACMIIAGPQVLGQIRAEAPDLNFGTARMVKGPASDEDAANFNVAQYWNFSITSKASNDPDKYDAAARFLRYLTTEEAVKSYTQVTGALPPLKSLMNDPMYTDDEYLKAFIETLPYSQAFFWVDEKAERQLSMDMADRIMLSGDDPREVLDWGAVEEQKLLDAYFAP
jgi:multiple sugar transport system substrate-binding protein